MMTVLVAFDFDHTICDGNTDVVARKLLPEERIPKDVKDLYKSSGWIAYMDRIFGLLHENSIDAQQIENAIVNIPPVPGMDTLLYTLFALGHEIVIISDSNSIFIDCWLKSKYLDHIVTRIFTNPARYNSDGRMQVDRYHTQHSCELSSVNLCKGQVLMDYVRERRDQGKHFDKVVYVGDGKNDLCPVLRLSQTDVACPRKTYPLIEALNKLPRNASMKAKIVPWENGGDLQRNLEQILEFRR